MHPIDVAGALRMLPHFKSVPAELVTRIAGATRVLEMREGEVLFRAGEPSRAFFVVQAGGVKLYRLQIDGHEQVVHNLRAGATFAEAALLSIGRYPVDAIATEPSTVLLEVQGTLLLELLRDDPRLAPAMIGSLCMRLLSLVERVEELCVVEAGARLARWLLRQPSTGDGEPVVDLLLPKKDLAAHLAMTPETLSRLLRRFQDDGWIRKDRHSIRLRDPSALLELADGGSRT